MEIGTCKTSLLVVLMDEYRTLDRLREYALDNIFKYFDFFRDVGLNSIHKRVHALHRSYQSNQLLIRSNLVSDNLEFR